MNRIDCVIKNLPDEYLRKVLDEEVYFPDINGQKDSRGICTEWYFVTFKSVRIMTAPPNGSRPIFEVWWIDHGNGMNDPQNHKWFRDGDEAKLIDTKRLVEELNNAKPFFSISGLPYEMYFMVAKSQ